MPDDKKILPYGLKDTKEASQPDHHKLSAFQVAPTRKTAFERAREQAQQKAEREAEETAAAYESFVAEYGTGEDPNVPPSNRTQRQRQEQDERFQRHQRSAKQVSQYASFDDVDSEEEERERKRLKLKSGASYLNELKTINQKRERYGPRQSQPSTERGREPIRQTQSIRETPRAAAPAVQETAPDEESSDEIDFYRSKPPTMPSNLALSTRSKARLKFLLNSITAERFAVAGVTAFAMTHSSCIDEITETISASITEYAEDWKTTIARLWCISDILHNSWLPIPNVWKYRSAFEIQLIAIFKHLRSVADSIESRIRRENFRRLVTSVLDVWDSWICFGDGVVETFYAAFDDKPVEQVEVVAVKPEKKSGGWRKLGEPAQAVVEAKKTPEREPDMNVDGEAIDLDGEEIDLDGEAVDLDEPIETAVQSPSVEEANATTPSTTTTTTTTAPNTSKIKMSFGKFKLPSRAVPQAVKPHLQDTTTSESSAKQTGRPAEAARRARPSAADFM